MSSIWRSMTTLRYKFCWSMLPCKVAIILIFCILWNVWEVVMTASTVSERDSKSQKLLVISFDGFRWDYLDLVKKAGKRTPVFDSLIENGVKAKWLQNLYATLTFPNHYSIATGLFEENHGVVNNKMYDPVLNDQFNMKLPGSLDPKWWNNGSDVWKGEPIWLTNQQTPGQRSGIYFWIGSQVAIRGQKAHYYLPYNWSVPFVERADTLISWFTHETEPINFGMLYYEYPDYTGHQDGADGTEIVDKIVELDENLGYLLNNLQENSLFQDMNLIITSDHGMENVKEVMYLEDFVDVSLFNEYGVNPILFIDPHEGKFDAVYAALLKVPNVHVRQKATMPPEFHYKYNRRISPLVVEAHVGYCVCVKRGCVLQKGDHGYDNSLSVMHPFFIAHGPAFKSGYLSEPFNNVDIYPLMCHLLGVNPALHDGSFGNIKHILADELTAAVELSLLKNSYPAMTALAAFLGVVFVIAGFVCLIKFGKQIPSESRGLLDTGQRSRSESQTLLSYSNEALETV